MEYKKMNKKGKGGAKQFIITAGVIGAMIYFIIFIVVGAGGGFKALWDIGKMMKQIPTWAWLGLAVIILFKMLFGKK